MGDDDPNDLQPEAYGYKPDRPGSMGSIRTHADPYANVRPAPSPARDDAEKAIAGLLARHTREDVGSYISCLCGWRHVGPYPTGARPYIAHLASVIAAHMAAPDELTALRAELDKALRLKDRYYEQFTERGKRFDDLRERIRALADEWEADSKSFSVLEWDDAIEQVRALIGGDA